MGIFLVNTLTFVVELLLYDQAWFCGNFLSDTVDIVDIVDTVDIAEAISNKPRL